MCMKQTMGRKNMEKFKFLNQVRKIERIEWVDSMTNKVLIRLMENIMLLNIILKTKAKNKIYYDRKRNVQDIEYVQKCLEYVKYTVLERTVKEQKRRGKVPRTIIEENIKEPKNGHGTGGDDNSSVCNL